MKVTCLVGANTQNAAQHPSSEHFLMHTAQFWSNRGNDVSPSVDARDLPSFSGTVTWFLKLYEMENETLLTVEHTVLLVQSSESGILQPNAETGVLTALTVRK